MTVTIMNLVTPKAGAKHELLFSKLVPGGCVEEKLMLSSLMCYRIHNWQRYDSVRLSCDT